MKIRAAILAFIASSFISAGKTIAGAPSDPGIQAEITASLNEFLAQNADPAQHDRFWADDLVYTSSAAKVQGKADIMKSMREAAARETAGPRPAYSAEQIVVRTYDGFAALNFRLVAKNPDGTTSYYRNSGTLVHRDGRWQAVTWQATREPEAK